MPSGQSAGAAQMLSPDRLHLIAVTVLEQITVATPAAVMELVFAFTG
jgi:hypothetical protein